MQATKYDYNALKLEYFKSDIDEIKWFRIDKGLNYNSRVATMTKWRWQEKQKRRDEIVAKALEREKNKISKKLEIPVEDLFKTKKQALEVMKAKLNQYIKQINGNPEEANISMKELEKIRKMTKVELWEPTIVQQNTGTINANLETSWPLVQIVRDSEDLPDDYSKDEIDDE